MPVDEEEVNTENVEDPAGCVKLGGENAREHVGEYGVVNMKALAVPHTLPNKRD